MRTHTMQILYLHSSPRLHTTPGVTSVGNSVSPTHHALPTLPATLGEYKANHFSINCMWGEKWWPDVVLPSVNKASSTTSTSLQSSNSPPLVSIELLECLSCLGKLVVRLCKEQGIACIQDVIAIIQLTSNSNDIRN